MNRFTGDYKISAGVDRLADKLRRLTQEGWNELEGAVAEITELARGAIIEKIKNDIEPHSGMHRKKNPQAVVTDLVDTGAYGESWQAQYPEPLQGKVATNIPYAAVLEYGTKDGAQKGFFAARDTAKKMTPIFRKDVEEILKRHLR